MPDRPKHILSIAGTEAVRKTRELLLSQSGFMVVSATGTRDLAHVMRRARFDLIIIGHAFDEKTKLKLAEIVRQNHASAPILELCRISPVIPGADFVLHSPEVDDLLDQVTSILRKPAK